MAVSAGCGCVFARPASDRTLGIRFKCSLDSLLGAGIPLVMLNSYSYTHGLLSTVISNVFRGVVTIPFLHHFLANVDTF